MHDNTSVIRTQSGTALYLDNYRLTRALWFAYHRPDDRRRYVPAFEVDDTPPVYRRLFDAIMEGDHKGLAALVLNDDLEAIDLFDYVCNIKPPRLMPSQRQDMPAPHSPISYAGMSPGVNHDDLAADLFSRMCAIDDAGPGTGQFPAPPVHTCAAKEETGTALIFRPNELTAARMISPTWRTCPACYHKRVKRVSQQTLWTIAAAGPMSWRMLEADEYKRWAVNLRQHRKRTQANAHYRAHPQEDGRYFVMSTHGLAGTDVPTDKAELFDLLYQYVKTPEGKRASASHGYGGNYRKLKGDGRGPGIRLWTDARLEAVAAAVGTKVRPGRSTLRIKIDQYDAYQRLSDAGIAMRACKGEGAAVTQLTDVTNKVQRDFAKDYTLFVTDTPPPPIAHDTQPRLIVTDEAAEVPIWPIYLP